MTKFVSSRYLCWLALIFGLSLLSSFVWLLHTYYSPSPILDSITLSFAGNETVKILLWTTIFRDIPKLDGYCPLETPCIFTTDRSEFESAHAIVYHGHDIWRYFLPRNTSKKLNVFYSMEASPILSVQSFWNFWKSSIAYHWVMGYMKSAHAYKPYGMLVNPEIGKQRGFKPVGNFTKEQVLASKKIKAQYGLYPIVGAKNDCESLVD